MHCLTKIARRLGFRYLRTTIGLGVLGLAWALTGRAHASFLFTDYLDPTKDGLFTDYSAWDFTSTSTIGQYPFYAPYNNPNYPTTAAPFGSYTTASAAGFTNPGGTAWSSQNPSAFWDARNPTITQVGTSTAFITSDGNIYSFAAPTSFVLNDPITTNVGTVIFQFQTVGSLVNTSSIELQYTNAGGTHLLSANESISEYAGSTSSYGGITNRMALQWDLAGLGVTSFQILFSAQSASMSLQQALLDTDASYATVVPSSGTYTGGTGVWSNTASWARNATNGNFLPQENANATFANPTAATVTLDASHTVGQLTFNTAANTTLNASNGSVLTSNTGITTTATATGTYTINAPFALNALNLFHINAGTVAMNGVISGNYSLAKDGNGTLILGANNTFTGDLDLQGGVLQINGTNTYTGLTNILFGTLIVNNNAALGNATSTISLGADSSIYANVGGASAGILIAGDHTLSRNITLTNGTFLQTLGAHQTAQGAVFFGAISLSTAANVEFLAPTPTDKISFSGNIIAGTGTGIVTLDGRGTVSFSGAGRTYNYANATNITSGSLRIESGVSFTGNGNVTIGSGAQLIVSGSLNGNGTLVNTGGTLSGSGTINRAFTIGTGDTLAPGDTLGTLNTISETWSGGGRLQLQLADATSTMGTGWDSIAITGTLSLSASSGSKFTLELDSLTTSGTSGLASNFNGNTSYSWEFLTASSGITGFSPSAFTIDTTGFQNALNGAFTVSQVGNNLFLNYTTVPEPSATGLALTGILGLLGRRRPRVSKR